MLRAGEKIRVLRVITRLNIGGPAIHVVNLTAGLPAERFETKLVCGTELPGEGSMLEVARARGVEPIQLPEIVNEFGLKRKDWQALRALRSLIRSFRPHIVHSHTAKAGFLARVVAHRERVPVIVHTFHGHVLHGYFDPVRTLLLRCMERHLARRSTRILAVSEQVRDDLVRFRVAPPEKIRVMPLGFDLAPFFESKALRGEFRRELGCGDEARLIGIVGRIYPIKNHRLFLEASARVAQTEPRARFVVAGDGALRREMEQLAADLGIRERTFFTGWRRDLPRIYADLDVLVVSSDSEGTPVAAIEAMAAGCPVVATRVGGLPELLCAGAAGLLVPPRDAAALSQAIAQVLHDGRQAAQLRATAAEHVRKKYDVARLLKEMEETYVELLGTATARGATRESR